MEPKSSNDERLEYLFLNMVGQVVEVHTTDGAITKGLFVSRTDPECTEVEPGIILSCTYFMRSEVHNALDKANFDPAHKKFAYKDIMFMEAENLKVRTDIPITAQRQQYRGEHDLKAIDFTEDVKCEVLEDESHHLGHWDQFEENKKFGVKSTFNEELYTTKLDHNKFTKEQFETAEKIAREIERGPTHGIMHRVERNEIALESEDDALYSDVTRMDGRKAHSPNMMNNNVNSARSPNRTSSPRGMVNNGTNNISSSRKNESKIASASSTSGSAKRSGAPIPHTVMKDGPSSSPRSPPSPTSSTSQTNTKITPAELEGVSSSGSNNKANAATATTGHSVSAAIQTANGEINNTNRTSSNNATPGHASESRKITVIDDFLKTIADAITHNQDNYNNSAEWPGAGNSYDEDDSYYSADAHRNEAYMSSAIHHNTNNNVNVNGPGAGGALPYSSRNVNEMNSNPMYHAHNAMMHPMSLHNTTTATPANMNMNTNNNNNMNMNAGMSMMPHQHQHQHAHMAMANPTHGHVPNMGSMNANLMGATTTAANNNNPTTTTAPAGMNVNMGAGHPTGTGVMNNTNNNNNPAFAAGMMPPAQMHHGHMHGNLNNNNNSTTGVNVNANSSHNTPGSLVNATNSNTNMMPANPNVNVGGYMPHHGMNMNMNQPNMSAVNQMGYNRPNMGFVPSPQQQQQPSSSSSPQQLSPPQQQGNMPASSLAHPSPHHQFTPNMNVGNMNPMMTSSNNNTNISGSGGTNTNTTNMHMQGTPQPSNMGMPNPMPSMMPLEIPANHYQSTMAPQNMNLSSGGAANNPHTSNTMANTMNSMNMNVTHSAGNTPGSLGNHPMPSHAYMDPNMNLNAAIPPSQGMLNSNTTTNNTVGGGMHMANQMNLMHPSPGPSSASRMPLPASQTRPAKGSQPQQPVSVTQSLQPNLNNTTPHPPSQQPTTTSTTSTNYSHNTAARPSSLHSSPPPASSSTSSQQPPQTTSTSTSATTTTTKGNTATTTAASANGSHPHQPLTSSTSQNNATGGNVVPAVDSSSSTTTTGTAQGSRHAASGSHASPGAQPTKQLRRGGGAGGNARSNAAAAGTGGSSTSSAAESSKKKESRFTADKMKEGKVKEKDGKPLH